MNYKPLNQRIMERLQKSSDEKDGILALNQIQCPEFREKIERYKIIRDVPLSEMISIFDQWFTGLWDHKLSRIDKNRILTHASLVHFDEENDAYMYLMQTPHNRYILVHPCDIHVFYGYKLFEVKT